MNPRDRLQYALQLKRLHELFVIKENIAFEYQNKNYNKAAEQIDKVVDKCLNDNILNTVDGTVSLKNPNLDHVISEALSSQQEMLVRNPSREIRTAVERNTQQFTNFLQNRIEKENHSLQRKIEEEYRKKKYNKLSEEESKKLIHEKFQDHGRKRAKNIVKDALHTNQSHISWLHNRDDYKYKVWMNGQGKGKVRDWHIASKIQPVFIDDYFDIYGSVHAQMMYPGDLYGGAENVANCRCWLRYTNVAPNNLKPKGTIQINPNVTLENENRETFSANTEKKGLFAKISKKISNTKEEIRNKFNISKTSTNVVFNKKLSDNDFKPKRDLHIQKEKNSKITNFINKTKKKINKLIKPVQKKLTPQYINFEGIILTQNELVDYISYKDLKKMLNKLPQGLTANLKQVIIHPYEKNVGRGKVVGSVDPSNPTILNLFKTDLITEEYYYTIIHELAHVLDSTIGGVEYYISNSQSWEDAFINDKKHISNLEKELGCELEYSEFVTDYAKDKYDEHLRNNQDHRRYAEDFADSVKLYFKLGDKTFSHYYPNRAKIIREVLGA